MSPTLYGQARENRPGRGGREMADELAGNGFPSNYFDL